MNTSKEYHQPVLEALSVFVRDATRSQKEVADRPSADRRFDSSFTALRLNCDDQGRLLARLGLFWCWAISRKLFDLQLKAIQTEGTRITGRDGNETMPLGAAAVGVVGKIRAVRVEGADHGLAATETERQLIETRV